MGNTPAKSVFASTGPDSKDVTDNKRSSKSIPNGSDFYPEFLVKLSEVLIKKSIEEENSDGINKKTFQKYISEASQVVGYKIFQYFLTKEGIHKENEEDYESKTLSKDMFIRQSYLLLNCLTDSQQLDYYIKVFGNDREEMSYNEFYELVSASYEIAQFAHHSGYLPDDLLSAICKAVMHGKELTTRTYIFNWISQHCPRIVNWMHRYISHTLTVGYSTIPANVPTEEEDNVTPVLESADKSSCATLHPALIWMLSCSLPSCYTNTPFQSPTLEESLVSLNNPHKFIQRLINADTPSHWIPLFNTDEHGLSINRFQHHVFDYRGPTLLLITTEDNTMFCVANDEEWKDSKHFYGGMNAMCFQLVPDYKIIDKGSKILYFNISSRGFPTGLQVGTDSTNRALTFDINLQLVHYRKIPFKLKSLEVWGCGTTRTKDKQMEYKKQVTRDVEKHRKVNLSQEWKDNPDRYLLEMAGTRPNYARFEKDTQNHSSLK